VFFSSVVFLVLCGKRDPDDAFEEERAAKTTPARFIFCDEVFSPAATRPRARRGSAGRYSDSRFVNAEAFAFPLAFARTTPDWLCSRSRGMKDCHRIPQRNCGRFSRPSLGLLIGLTRPEPDACHAKERKLF